MPGTAKNRVRQQGKGNRDSKASEPRGQQKAVGEQRGQQKATRPAGSARNPKQQPHDALMGSKEAAKQKCQNSTLKHSIRRARTAKTAEPANSGDSQTRQGQQGQGERKKTHNSTMNKSPEAAKEQQPRDNPARSEEATPPKKKTRIPP